MDIKQKTIICIDDNPSILKTFKTILASQEIEVITATNMRDGWGAISDQKPDLIILDMFISGIDSWKLYEMLKASKELRQIPLILLSTSDRSGSYINEQLFTVNPAYREKDRILEKPLSKMELIDNVKKALNGKMGNIPSEIDEISAVKNSPQHRFNSIWSTGVDRRGSGVALLGESDHRVETSQSKTLVSAVKTAFITLVNIPLIPLVSYRVTIGEITEGYVFNKYTHYNHKVKQSFHIRQIGEVYGLAILCLLGFPVSLQFALFVPQLLFLITEKPSSELGWVSFLILGGFLLLWLYVAIKIAHFVARKRRNQAINEYRKEQTQSLRK